MEENNENKNVENVQNIQQNVETQGTENVQEKKKKSEIGLTIFLIIVIIALVGGIGYLTKMFLDGKVENGANKNNSVVTTNQTEKNKDIEQNNNNELINKNNLSNIIAFATGDDDYVYAVTKDGNNIKLLNLKDYMTDDAHGNVLYTYNNGKLYMYINSFTPGKYDINTGAVIVESKETNQFGYIDLNEKNGKYTYSKLADVDLDGSLNQIAFANNNIYFCQTKNDNATKTTTNTIYKFNIDSKEIDIDTNFVLSQANYAVVMQSVNNENIAYKDASGIYIINVKNGEKTTITTDSNKYLEYAYGNKVIIMDSNYGGDYWKYFEYDISNKTEKQISEESQHPLSIVTWGILPKDNYYIYIKDNEVYNSLNNDKLGEFGSAVSDIFLISEDKLGIVWLDGQVEHKSIINLKNNEIQNNIDLIKFTSIVYLK